MYDCIDPSPFYTQEPYLDENDAIEVSNDDLINLDPRKFPYGPTLPNFTGNMNNVNQKGS